jgi:hypothetical protein
MAEAVHETKPPEQPPLPPELPRPTGAPASSSADRDDRPESPTEARRQAQAAAQAEYAKARNDEVVGPDDSSRSTLDAQENGPPSLEPQQVPDAHEPDRAQTEDQPQHPAADRPKAQTADLHGSQATEQDRTNLAAAQEYIQARADSPTPQEASPDTTDEADRTTGLADGADAMEFPESWNKFNPAHHREFATALDELRGNGDLEPNPGLRGGEGQLFLGSDDTQALKRWFESRQEDMPQSIDRMNAAAQLVDADPTLGQDMSVVEIGDRGSDWVKRGFDPDSIPLKQAVNDPEVAAARERCIAALTGSTDPTAREILRKLTRNSANLHWSPTSETILIIDMQ